MNLDITGLGQTAIRNVIYDIERLLRKEFKEVGLEQVGTRTVLILL